MNKSRWNRFLENLEDHPFLRKLICIWYNRAQEATDFFDRFIYIWIAFEAFTSNYTERNWPTKVRNILKKDKKMNATFSSLMLDKSFSRLVLELQKNCPVWDAREKYSKNPDSSKSIEDPNDFGEVLEVLYKIRNNLFHGGKRPDIERDKLLVKLSFNIVHVFLDSIISEVGICVR